MTEIPGQAQIPGEDDILALDWRRAKGALLKAHYSQGALIQRGTACASVYVCVCVCASEEESVSK